MSGFFNFRNKETLQNGSLPSKRWLNVLYSCSPLSVFCKRNDLREQDVCALCRVMLIFCACSIQIRLPAVRGNDVMSLTWRNVTNKVVNFNFKFLPASTKARNFLTTKLGIFYFYHCSLTFAREAHYSFHQVPSVWHTQVITKLLKPLWFSEELISVPRPYRVSPSVAMRP